MALFSRPTSHSSWVRRAGAGLCLLLVLGLTGCGLLGGGEEDDDGYPEPPGRPSVVAPDHVQGLSLR